MATKNQLLGKVQSCSGDEPKTKTGASPSWHMSEGGDSSAIAAPAVMVAAAAATKFATKGVLDAVGRPGRHGRH